MNVKRGAAMSQCLQDSAQDVCEELQQIVDAVDSLNAEEEWQQAQAKLADLEAATNIVLSSDETDRRA
jgi:hypothetical protein